MITHHNSDKYLLGLLLKAKFHNKTFPPIIAKDSYIPTLTSLFSTSIEEPTVAYDISESVKTELSTFTESVLVTPFKKIKSETHSINVRPGPDITTFKQQKLLTNSSNGFDTYTSIAHATLPTVSLKVDSVTKQGLLKTSNLATSLGSTPPLVENSDTGLYRMPLGHTGNVNLAGNVGNTSTVDHDEAFRNKFPSRLLRIFDGIKAICREKHKVTPALETDGPYCNRTIDRLGGCWPDTPADTTATTNCPAIPGFNEKALLTRYCTQDGTWYIDPHTNSSVFNYSNCQHPDDVFSEDTKYIYIFIGGFLLSLLMLLVSLGIFFRFRQLRCERITIHKNLFISYIFTGLSWILYYVLAALDGDVLLSNPVWCQGLHVMCQYFTVCNFMWMFCEGLYLNTIMVYAFSSGKTLIICCYIVGWGFPVILTAIYAGVRSRVDIAAMDCWIGESVLQWIMYGPIVLSLVVNVIFLINIVRLLITKLRQMPEVAQTRKAARATLILVPLLGLQYLLFPIRPAPDSDLEEFYHTVVALLVSLQGAFVSVMYCFCNGEVITVVRRKWNQHKLMSKSSIRNTSVHGGTTYTTVDHDQTQANATTYYSTSDNKDPPLELAKLDKDGRQ